MGLFHRELARWEAQGLHRTALEHDGARLSFGELAEAALRAARLLRVHGLQPGDVLAIQLPRCPEWLVLHLAALAMGVATLPLHDQAPPAEVDARLLDAGAALALLAEERPAPVRALSLAGLRARLARCAPLPLPPPPALDEVAALLYTSGTTGEPKGARLSHGNLLATIEALHAAWRWSPEDALLHVLPLFHVHGLVVAQHGALFAAARTRWLDRFEPARALTELSGGLTVFMGVPTHYQRFLALPPEVAPDLSGVRLFTSGSAALPAATHRAFRERFGHEILERYGMTEVGIVLSNPYEGPRLPGSVGYPLPGVRARIVDEEGRDRPPGEVGELWIAGPSVFQGYHGRPEATAAAMAGPFLRTGDLARRAEDGRIELVGRSRELIISGGFNVYPAEVEAALAGLPGLAELAVFGRPDADKGERVVAAVVLDGSRPLEEVERALRARAAERLSPYKRPVALRVRSALPRNTLGKLQRHLLDQDEPPA